MKILKKIFEYFDDFYCWLIPYNWRFRHLYNTYIKYRNHIIIRPKYIDRHGWCDKTELLPDLMFTLLDNFIIEECTPELVDWEGSGHFVEVNGEQINVRKEMDNILTWWHEDYHKKYPEESKRLWKEIEQCGGKHKFTKIEGMDASSLAIVFPSKEYEKKYRETFDKLHELDQKMQKELISYMIRLCKLQPFLWT